MDPNFYNDPVNGYLLIVVICAISVAGICFMEALKKDKRAAEALGVRSVWLYWRGLSRLNTILMTSVPDSGIGPGGDKRKGLRRKPDSATFHELAAEAWRDPTAYKFIDDLLYRIPEARSEFASGPPREHVKVEHEAWVKKCCIWADIGRVAHAATRCGHETLDNALLACWEETTPGVEEKKSLEHRIQQNWSYWGFPDAF